MASQLADYEITSSVLEDGTMPCLRARRPARLGGDSAPVTIWILGPLARTPWTAARSRLEPVAAVRGDNLPQWLEAGVADWAQRPVIWVSASTAVTGTLASATSRDGRAGAAAGHCRRRSRRSLVARAGPAPRGHLPSGGCARYDGPGHPGRSATSGPQVPASNTRRARSSVSGERGAPRGPGWVPTSGLHRPPTAER